MDLEKKRTVFTLSICVLLYYFVNFWPFQFVILLVGIWFSCRNLSGKCVHFLFMAFCALTFAAAFIINPVSLYLQHNDGSFSSYKYIYILNSIIVLAGMFWLITIGFYNRSVCLKKYTPDSKILGLIILCIMAMFLGSWNADIAYAGDEGYHMTSIVPFRVFLYDIFSLRGNLIFMIIWLLCPVGLYFFKDKKKYKIFLNVWIFIGFIFLIKSIPWNYRTNILQENFTFSRTGRYPAAQAFYSALLGSLQKIYMFNVHFLNKTVVRFLPPLFLSLLLFFLASGQEWKKQHVFFAFLATMTILTIPNFLYHGTMLYLEIPAIFLMTIVLFDSRSWMELEFKYLSRRPSWWAGILLGFTKETVFPFILFLFLARITRCFIQTLKEKKSFFKLFLSETFVCISILLPAVIYYIIRKESGSRPYGNNFQNIYDIQLIFHSLKEVILQTGIILIPALLGIGILIKEKKWSTLILAVGSCFIMWLFFLCDERIWLDLARFNLLLLPGIIFLAWYAMTFLLKKNQNFLGSILIFLMAINLLMSPINTKGERKIWGNSDEHWYKYEECLLDLKEQNISSILMTNMNSAYFIRLTANELNWNVNIRQKTPLDSDKKKNLQKGFNIASQKNILAIIHRVDGDLDIVKSIENKDYKLVKIYTSRSGSLAVFLKK